MLLEHGADANAQDKVSATVFSPCFSLLILLLPSWSGSGSRTTIVSLLFLNVILWVTPMLPPNMCLLSWLCCGGVSAYSVA